MNPNTKALLRSTLLLVLMLALVGGAFVAGMLFEQRQNARLSFPLFEEAYSAIETRGYNPLPERQKIEYGLIRGLVQAYDDPYTVFLEPPQNELENNKLEGRFGGIGATIEKDAAGFWLLYPLPDSPAAKAGLQEGDRLLQVDALPITGTLPSDPIVAALRGPVDSAVEITAARPPAFAPFKVSVLRLEFPLPSVSYRLAPDEPRLGVIKINWMADPTTGEVQKAVAALQERGAQAFALDLRGNPGGLLDSGVNLARLFLKDGLVMQQQYKGRPVDTFNVESPGPLSDIPLVVLIDKNSASAAEIAAGALKARGRAKIIGVPSYGKDTIQLIITLADGSSLHITAAHWWIPGLQPAIGGNGVQPDVVVQAGEPDAADNVLIEAGREIFR